MARREAIDNGRLETVEKVADETGGQCRLADGVPRLNTDLVLNDLARLPLHQVSRGERASGIVTPLVLLSERERVGVDNLSLAWLLGSPAPRRPAELLTHIALGLETVGRERRHTHQAAPMELKLGACSDLQLC